MELLTKIITFLVALLIFITLFIATIYGMYWIFVSFGAPKWIAIMVAVGIVWIGSVIGKKK